MPDREKVMLGLTKCGRVHRSLEDCAECPYKLKPGHYAGMECWCRLCDDALALLKEQEPRVIYDASEIKLDTVYWMEKRNIVTPWPVAMKMYSQRFPEQLEFEDYYGERWTVSRFLVGKEGWRLWTARPTDEQRREAAWHA